MTVSIATLHSLMRIGVTIKPLSREVSVDGRTAPFSADWKSTLDAMHRELFQHGAELTVLEIDLSRHDFKQDGSPRSDRRSPRSAGVRLKFRATSVPGSPVLEFDAGEFYGWDDNVRALALGLEALRKADRYGITKRGEQYAGFKELPAPWSPSPERGREIIARHGGRVADALRATHPDTSGYESTKDFADVQAARGS